MAAESRQNVRLTCPRSSVFVILGVLRDNPGLGARVYQGRMTLRSITLEVEFTGSALVLEESLRHTGVTVEWREARALSAM